LLEAVTPLLDDPAEAIVTPLGEWGRWINGGTWLAVSEQKAIFCTET
jgi:hypothetical protein